MDLNNVKQQRNQIVSPASETPTKPAAWKLSTEDEPLLEHPDVTVQSQDCVCQRSRRHEHEAEHALLLPTDWLGFLNMTFVYDGFGSRL